ncbi:hypothetical protein HS088_TW07G01244 [Tripterygium wilfordii]|uniref:Pentatricopeptide repeat-containing protein n=1 Tax=Tripterygium wilfordii TaxID=458696 RepID=A0A7J7DH34_TRIWF|nr:hypothetical protein HS088_TW07G01244 [Tripterygium wilfordii]
MTHVESHCLDARPRCVAIGIVSRLPSQKPALQLLKQATNDGIATNRELFDALVIDRDELGVKSSIVFDCLIRAYCELRRGDDALECFYMMKKNRILPKEGKLKKAKDFIGFMESLGVTPNIVTYNTIIQGYCSRVRFEAAHIILSTMKDRGVTPDS